MEESLFNAGKWKWGKWRRVWVDTQKCQMFEKDAIFQNRCLAIVKVTSEKP